MFVNKPLFILQLILIFFSISTMSMANNTHQSFKAIHPQWLSIEPPSIETDLKTGEILRASTWKIKSNNAVKIRVAGLSPEIDQTTNIPRFYKQKINAKNQTVANEYFYLTTSFGAKLANINNPNQYSTWRGGETPNGSPAEVINNLGISWGSIMPNIDSDSFDFTLYSKGIGAVNNQSGTYTLIVNLNVTAEEVSSAGSSFANPSF